MNKKRRDFLKVAGLSAAALCVSPAGALASSHQGPKANKDGLDAKRWGMVIDTRVLNSEESFKPLIEACHSIHNVPDIPTKQNIKWLWSAPYHEVFPEQTNTYMAEDLEHKEFLLLCNHCDNPPCVRVCPTKATYKRADGIVAMDYHRCIGCRYCMAGCPYGSRSFNFGEPREFLDLKNLNKEFPTRMRGVVEKCNFCVERLAVGKQPACVEASNGAITFGDLSDPNSEVRKVLKENYTIRRKPALGTEPSVYYII